MLGEFWDFVTTAGQWWGPRGILPRTREHLELAGLAFLLAALIALPLGVLFGHRRRGAAVANAVVNMGRAVPTYAVIALLFPITLQLGLGPLGFWGALVALVLLGVPPIFTNSYTAVSGVDVDVVEAAAGMGMRPAQVLRGVEVPVALPLIIAGLRISAVQVAATAPLASVFGYNALGSFVIEGLSQQDDAKLLTGAVSVGLLAVVISIAFSLAERRLVRWRHRPSEARNQRRDEPVRPEPVPT